MPIPIGMPQQFYEDETLRAGSWYNVGQWRAHANMSATGPIYRQLLYEQSDQVSAHCNQNDGSRKE
jgi:hypothetical protein